MTEILKVDGLSKQFTKKNLFGSKTSVVKAVENVTFTLHDDEVLVIYEMQTGKPSEDDIVRLEDDYGRAG